MTVTIGLVAGEASGDLLGRSMIEAIRRQRPDAQFVGIGGPLMIGAGMRSWYPQERLAVRGLVEVLKHVPEIARIRRGLLRQLLEARPAVVIGIDSPDFNLGLEQRLRRRGIRTMHCVSPTIWAWRSGRINTIRRAVDHMLVLFPFEEALYRRAGIAATFIGHPLADEIGANPDRDAAREQLRLPLDAKVVALLPGSRASEVEMLGATLADCALRIHRVRPDVRFLVPLVTAATRNQFEQALYDAGAKDLPVTLLYGHAHEAMAASDVVVAASGTATLEAALIGRPTVVTYRLNAFTYWLARRLVRTRFIALPNILADEALCPEFIQDEATGENLAQATLNYLGDARLCASISERFAGIRAQLRRGAADRAAGAILDVSRADHVPAIALP